MVANETKLPETLTWYRDGANWIVALSTGAIAVGFGVRDGLTVGTNLARTAFLLAGLAFAAAVSAGVFLYFWLTAYGSRHEKRSRLSQELSTEQDASKKVSIKREVDAAADVMEKAKFWISVFYKALLSSFFAGVLSGLAAVLLLVLQETPTSRKWQVVTAPCCQVRCRIPQPHVLLLNEATGQSWYLDSAAGRPAAWFPIPMDSGAGRP